MTDALGNKARERKQLEDLKPQKMNERERREEKQQLVQEKKAHTKIHLSATTTCADTSSNEVRCPACSVIFQDPPNEDWIKCCKCLNWWHDSCSN